MYVPVCCRSNSTSLNGLADWFAEMTVYSDVRVKNIERYLPLALVATFIAYRDCHFLALYLFVFYFLSVQINSDIFEVRHVLIFQMYQPIGLLVVQRLIGSNYVSLNFLKYINVIY